MSATSCGSAWSVLINRSAIAAIARATFLHPAHASGSRMAKLTCRLPPHNHASHDRLPLMMYENKSARVAAFVAAFHRDQVRHACFFGDGAVEVWPGRGRPWVARRYWGDVDLENLTADWPGRGWGSAALRRLETLADLHGISIFVVARSRHRGPGNPPDGTLGQQALLAFYAHRGFQTVASRNGNAYMVRPRRSLDRSGRRTALLDMDEAPRWRGLPMPGEPGSNSPGQSGLRVGLDPQDIQPAIGAVAAPVVA